MPKFTVTAPDGTSSVEEAPTQQAAIAIAQQKKAAASGGFGSSLRGPTAIARQVQPGETPLDIGTTQSLAAGVRGLPSRTGDIAATVAPLFVPGSGLLSFAGRLGAAEVGQDVGDVLTGQKVTPGAGSVSQLVGEGVGKAVAPLLSARTFRSFADRQVKALTSKLDELVPSWKDLPATARGLWERAHGIGQRELSHKFDGVIRGIKHAVPEDLVLKVPTRVEIGGKVFDATSERNARQLIDDLPELRKAGGPEYRRALKALADQLPQGLSPQLDAIRSEYKNGSGWIDFAERGKFLKKERYDPEKAQDALTTWGKKTLLGRGLDDIAAIVRGPGAKPIEGRTLTPWSKRMAGSELGEPVLGHGLAGLTGSVFLPSEIYSNVPLSGAQRFAGRLGKSLVGEGLRETARDLDVKDKLPGFGGPP